MIRRLVLLAATALAGCTGSSSESAGSGPPVTVRLRLYPDVGQSVTVNHFTSSTSMTKNIDAAGKETEDGPRINETDEVYVEKTLEAGEKAPTKLQRQYQKSQVTLKGKDKGSYPRTYKNRLITYELTKSDRGFLHYEPKVVGDPLDDPDDLVYAYTTPPDAPNYLQPPKPVKVGEKWPIDVGQSLAENSNFNKDKSSGEGVLTKVYTKDGKQYGVIEAHLKQAFEGTNVIDSVLTFDGVTAPAPKAPSPPSQLPPSPTQAPTAARPSPTWNRT